MQHVQEYSAVSARLGIDKNAEIASEITKKIRTGVSQPRETECRVPRVTTDRRDPAPLSPHQSDTNFQPAFVAEKYLLLDQVEGSSLYRCVDINTKEELVCKVRIMLSSYLSSFREFYKS